MPYMPEGKGQGRGNSGVYVQGRYEVQVLDSYGLKSKNNDCGGIYRLAAPLVNACKAPTVWQSYDIEFTAPKCEDGKKVEPARMTVYHNGVKIHDNVRSLTMDNTTAGMGGDSVHARPDHAARPRQPGAVPQHLAVAAEGVRVRGPEGGAGFQPASGVGRLKTCPTVWWGRFSTCRAGPG